MKSKEVDEHKSSSVQQVGAVVSYFRHGDVNTVQRPSANPQKKRKWRTFVKMQSKQR